MDTIKELIKEYKHWCGKVMYHQCAEGGRYWSEFGSLCTAKHKVDEIQQQLEDLGVTIEGNFDSWVFKYKGETIQLD